MYIYTIVIEVVNGKGDKSDLEHMHGQVFLVLRK